MGKGWYKVIALMVLLEERLCEEVRLPALLERRLVFIVSSWHLNLLLCQQLKASGEDFATALRFSSFRWVRRVELCSLLTRWLRPWLPLGDFVAGGQSLQRDAAGCGRGWQPLCPGAGDMQGVAAPLPGRWGRRATGLALCWEAGKKAWACRNVTRSGSSVLPRIDSFWLVLEMAT